MIDDITEVNSSAPNGTRLFSPQERPWGEAIEVTGSSPTVQPRFLSPAPVILRTRVG